ncbi:MAG: hypothetical protein ACLGI7_11060 [Gammaproteobacteria bacterium]
MKTKKPAPQSQPESEKKPPAKRSAIKQPLQKPEPWRFGGRGPQGSYGGGAKASPDAERRAGKSRKVH